MNENNLQNNQTLNNNLNQNSQTINNANQNINMQTSPMNTNTAHQANPSPMNTNTAHQANPSSISTNTTHQASPSSMSTNTVHQTNPSSMNTNTTHQASPSPMSTNITAQANPSPISTNTTHQASPSPMNTNTTHQASPSPMNTNTVHQASQTNQTIQQSTSDIKENQTKQQELNLVNPLNTDEIIKKEILTKKQVPEENNDSNINSTIENEEKPKKKKLNPILLVLLVVVIASIGVVLYFTLFNNSEPDTPNPPNNPNNPTTPETPVTPQITLNDILNNFNNNENVNQLKETSDITASINNNVITIDVTTDGQTNSYLFTLENRDLVFEINPNDLTSNLLFLIICDNIGQFHSLKTNEVYNYLSSIDLTTTAVNGITLNQLQNGNYQVRINIDTKIDTSSLNTMYIELNDLESYREFLEGTGTVQIPKGNLMLYKEGNENNSTILIGEKDNLTNLTYNSILSVIELLYPDDLENFKTGYPNLETISFDRYTITMNPELTGTLETLYGQYQNEYKFILIEINKNL